MNTPRSMHSSSHLGVAAALSLAPLLGGCSLLIDTSQYQGGTSVDGGSLDVDGGQPDGRVTDGAMPDPDARVGPEPPSMPGVVLTPGAPSTLDDLAAEIVTPSIDPSGPSVHYEFRWLSNDVPLAEMGPFLGHDVTAKGSRIAVEVTPISDTTELSGPPGRAEVEIVNTPPTLSSVAVSTYRPVAGERISAKPGIVADPDGDRIAIHFQWHDEAGPMAGATGPDLTTAPDWGARTLFVEAWASDGEAESMRVRSGPIRVLDDVTRWRQLRPNLGHQSPPIYGFDSLNGRWLHYADDGLWEFGLTDTAGRWTKLFPEGAAVPPLAAASAVFDEDNHRLIVFGGIEQGGSGGGVNGEVFALDVSVRGGETWSRVAVAGAAPSGRAFPSALYDRPAGRILYYGGFTSDGFEEDLWELDIRVPGGEVWRQHVVATPGPLLGALLVRQPHAPVAYLFGGGEQGTDGITPVDRVYRIDLAASPVTFTLLSATTPRPLLAAVGYADAARNRALVAYGMTEGDVPLENVYAFDFGSETFEVLATGGDDPKTGFFGQMFSRPGHPDQATIVPGSGGDGTNNFGFSIYGLDLASMEFTTVEAPGINTPPPLMQAGAIAQSGAMHVWGGLGPGSISSDQMWTYEPRSDAWRLTPTMPDPVTSNSPGARYGNVIESNGYWERMIFFSGRDGDRLLDNATFSFTGGRWTEHTLATTVGQPGLREGAAFFFPACGADVAGFFGGRRDSGGSLLRDSGLLSCASGERDCTWRNPATVGPVPASRAFATPGYADRRIVFFGGQIAGGATAEVWELDVCSGGGSQVWYPMAPTGPAPRPRYGHTLSRRVGSSGTSGPPMDFVIIGGGVDEYGENAFGDAFLLSKPAAGVYRWSRILPAPDSEALVPRQFHVAAHFGDGDRVLVFGGITNYESRNDLWELLIRPRLP